MPKVSVIVPLYNTEKYCKKCIESILNQTLEDIEIIIVNDGSTDNSKDVALPFVKKYKEKVKYIEKENGGLSSARNAGLKIATGDYVGFVDSDDYIDNTMYEKMYRLAVDNNLDLVECNFKWVYPNKEKLDLGKEYKLKQDYFINGRVMACNKLIRLSIIKEYNIEFPDKLRYEDIEFFYKLMPYISKSGIVEDVLYHYIQREESIINKQNEKTKEIFTILDNIVSFYKKKELFSTYKEELEYLHIRFLLGSSFLRMVKIQDKVIKKDLLQKNWRELNEKFPNWRNNEILKIATGNKNLYYKTVNKFTYKIYSKLFALK